MSVVWKVLLGLALVVPMGAYVVGSLVASTSGSVSGQTAVVVPAPLGERVVEPGVRFERRPPPEPRPEDDDLDDGADDGAGDDVDDGAVDDGGVEVVTPEPQPVPPPADDDDDDDDDEDDDDGDDDDDDGDDD
ncbi:hypothetical protein [Nocardioides sp. CFH 31398]|uniref:hypothetical protein n=1 Tax=Nocardioides sp. CFH 31398 TaxID=2919579 RepID=UPI001F054B46|nr:hypothetical protein [Nocardioides sp. CFH 31398]MCH1868476.1 hypothetical protein [Nocardioides sp. CFH 31398]